MRLEIETDKPRYRVSERITVRLRVINDSYVPVLLDRRMLIAPTPILRGQRGMPYPIVIEPAATDPDRNILLLNPFCFYGRERVHDGLPAGSVELRAYLTRRLVDHLAPQGPLDPGDLEVEATPITTEIDAVDAAGR